MSRFHSQKWRLNFLRRLYLSNLNVCSSIAIPHCHGPSTSRGTVLKLDWKVASMWRFTSGRTFVQFGSLEMAKKIGTIKNSKNCMQMLSMGKYQVSTMDKTCNFWYNNKPTQWGPPEKWTKVISSGDTISLSKSRPHSATSSDRISRTSGHRLSRGCSMVEIPGRIAS